jgi:hypothetical protein
MTGRRAAIGLSVLCALALSAFAAPSAMALKGTTAFTCQPELKPTETTKGFEDEHCTKALTGTKVKFVHSEIAPNTKTLVTVTNNETGEKESKPKFLSTIAGVNFELEGTGFMSCVEKTTIENKVNAAKQMEASGSGCGSFTGVQVIKPGKCALAKEETILGEGSLAKTVVKEPKAGVSEMYGEAVPPESGIFAEFSFAGAECPLKGTVVKITGTARSNVTTNEAQLDGATVKTTTAETEKTLKVGGNVAKTEFVATVRMAPVEKLPENPLVVTTTSS